jgi:hypothetical protein
VVIDREDEGFTAIPADGMNAAIKMQDFGTSRWPLCDQATSLVGRLKRGGMASPGTNRRFAAMQYDARN